MNKESVRHLAFGFLASAILTAAFAVFVQGNVPVKGMQISGLLDGANKESLAVYESQVEALAQDKANLTSTNKDLNESIATLTKDVASLEKQVKQLNKTKDKADLSSDESASAEAEATSESSAAEQTAEKVTFTVNQGENSSSIASRLEAEGIIKSASELQTIFDTWNLNTILVADTYQFTKGMDPNVVAEMLTGGAYYYQP